MRDSGDACAFPKTLNSTTWPFIASYGAALTLLENGGSDPDARFYETLEKARPLEMGYGAYAHLLDVAQQVSAKLLDEQGGGGDPSDFRRATYGP